MRKSPGFTATAILCLALGIGTNSAIFSIIRKVLVEPLPFPDAGRIVTVGRPGSDSSESPQRYAYWTASDHGLRLLTAYQPGFLSLRANEPETVATLAVSFNYFSLFGASPASGRTFSRDEDRPGGRRVAVLSHGFWQRAFGGDPAILGTEIVLGDQPYAVVGILSRDFTFYFPVDVWMPLQADLMSKAEASTLTVAARLPDGITLGEANARMRAIAARFASENPGRRREVQVADLHNQLTGDLRPMLLMLQGAVGLVLLVACANVGSLLLARAASRQKEIAVRAAIGAARARLVRQLVTESLVLAVSGGAAGLLAGSLSLRLILAFLPADLPRVRELGALSGLDPWVCGFTLLLSVVTGVLSGLYPALRISRTPLAVPMREVQTRSRALRAFVAGQMAAALVLLTGALLLIRSFSAMYALSTGFDSRDLLTMEVSLTGGRYARSQAVDAFARQVVDRLTSVAGVQSAAVASALPLFGKTDMIFDIPGRSPGAARRFTGDVQWRFVTADYFRVLGIPIVAGRGLERRETSNTVVISREMARQFWHGQNPVGQRIVIGPGLGAGVGSGLATIIGVAGDVRERLDHSGGAAVMYQLPSQIPDQAMALMNRLESTAILIRVQPGATLAGLQRSLLTELRAVDRLPVRSVRTMERARRESTPRHSLNLFLLGSFASIAVLLAMIGIYGVTTYAVERQRSEIGIRSALGATRSQLLVRVLRGGRNRRSRCCRRNGGRSWIHVADSFAPVRCVASRFRHVRCGSDHRPRRRGCVGGGSGRPGEPD